MKKRNLPGLVLGIVGLLWSVAAGEPPKTLTLADLAGRPERWPATVKVTANVRSKTGQTVLEGQTVPVVSVTEKGVFVRNAGGAQIGLFPAQCDLLAQANARWARLSPAQRTLDREAVLADSSLWPETVALLFPMKITLPGGGSRVLPVGHPCRFFYYHDGNVGVLPDGISERKWFKPDSVDLLAGGIERAGLDPARRPSRLADALRPLLRDAAGKPTVPASLARGRAFVFFWGANWCGWCHKVSPELAAFVTANRERLQDVTVVMLDGDKQDAEMLKYLQEKKLPWPAVRMADWTRLPYFSLTHEGSYPQLLITDRFGKILYNGGGGGPKDIAGHLAAMEHLAAGTLVWTAE